MTALRYFNEGKIEQVGTPSEIYERPASPFVAGFVGTSNLISGEVAKRITGSEEMFSIRPEKIHLGSANDEACRRICIPSMGIVRDVVYLGFVHPLSGRDRRRRRLVVIEQNLKTTSMDVLIDTRTKGVACHWHKDHISRVGG